jgi:metal-dependent amidase/aminoacylase/carboxypeptidase family protein
VKTVGADMVSDTAKASMGAEDFSVMLEKVPGAYVWLGAGEACPPLHHASFDFNDALLPIGAQLFVNMALESLQE